VSIYLFTAHHRGYIKRIQH